MSTFAITPDPSKIYLGDQGIVTLYNEGPSTVWLDNQPGVSHLNGFELQPRGQMTWNADKELWAATRTFGAINLTAKLRTSVSGGLSVTTRSQYYSLIGQSNNAFASTFIPAPSPFGCEVGHCATVRILRKFVRSGAFVAGQQEFLQLAWYDDDQNIVFTEQIVANLSQLDLLNNTTDYYLVNVPVKGRYLGIQPTSTVFFSSAYVKVFGTDQDEPYWCNSGFTPPAGFTALQASEGMITVTNFNGNLVIPSMGNRVGIYCFTGGAAAAGHVNIIDNASGNSVAAVYLTAALNEGWGVVDINPRRAYYVTTFGLPLPIAVLSLSFSNYP